MPNSLRVSAAFCFLLSSGAMAQAPLAPDAAMPRAEAAPTTAMPYVAMAGASDRYEIESSRLAATQAKSRKVKDFARMMVSHHTMTTKEVVSAARMTPPPPALEAEQAAMIAELRPLSGEAFDQAYVSQQKIAHMKALALHQGYASNGDTPSLRAAATKAVPIVQRHIAELEGM